MIGFVSPLYAKADGIPPPPQGPIDPATLFVGGMTGAWWDPSDLATLWQDDAGTVPAAIDSRVGRIADKSGNGHHLTQATATARPFLRSAGGLNWLEFDGVDDFLVRIGSPGAVGDIFFALRAPADSKYMMGYEASDGGRFFGVSDSASASATHLGSGTPTLLLNGGGVANSRSALQSAIGTVAAVHELHNADLSGWAEFKIGKYLAFEFSGQFFGAVTIAAQPAAARTGIRKWIGAKAGLSL